MDPRGEPIRATREPAPPHVFVAPSPEGPRTSALVALLFAAGLLFLVLTPPFQVPDEPNHLLRAFQVSEGDFRSTMYDGRRGGLLPEPLIDVAVNGFVSLRAHAEVRTSWPEWRATMAASPSSGEIASAPRRPINLRNTGQYSPVPYVPAASALWIGRALGLDAYGLLYAARLATLTAAMLIVFAALALLGDQPRARLVLFLIAGTPMALSLFAGGSAHAVTNALALLVLATSSSLWRRWSEPLFATLLVVSALLSLCKGAYLLLPFAALPAFAARRREGHAVLCQAAALPLAAFLPALLWSHALGPGAVRIHTGVRVDPLQSLATDPLGAGFAVAGDMVRHTARYASEMIGVLGWLDTKMPLGVRLGYAALLAAAALVGVRAWDRFEAIVRTRAPLQRTTLAAVAIATVLLIYVIALLNWSQAGGPEIRGLQGRYFLAAAPLLLLALPTVVEVGPSEHRRLTRAALVGWGVAMLASIAALTVRYWTWTV